MTGLTLTVGHERVEQTFTTEPAPICTLPQGETLTVATRSLHTGGAFDRSVDYTDLSIPITGPIELVGVRAGERIRIDVHGIDIADRGAMVTLPGRGAFAELLGTSGRSLPISDGMVHFGDGVGIPVRPMIGKIGVAVPGTAPGSSTVGTHGGNLDCKDVTPGAAVYLTALVDGALLYVGDLHACQGDGESSLTGVEVEGAVTLSWRRVPEPPVASTRPMVRTADGRLLAIGDGDTLAEAVHAALTDMLELVGTARGWPRETTAAFLSIAADVGICQLVNPRLSAKVAVAVEHLAGTSCEPWLLPAHEGVQHA